MSTVHQDHYHSHVTYLSHHHVYRDTNAKKHWCQSPEAEKTRKGEREASPKLALVVDVENNVENNVESLGIERYVRRDIFSCSMHWWPMVDGRWSMGEEGDLQTSTSIPGGGKENLSSKKFTNRSLNKRFIKESYF